jgi:molybdate transport system ATP-binding protein
VFQDGRLFPHLSVRQNLRYGTWFTRGGGGDFGRIVGLLGIGALLDRRPANLSGGERSRVAIGRALMTRPRLLILDEPLASLDRARAEEILPYLEGLRDEVGLPILHVSHAIEEVVRLADHLVLLDRGRVTAFGPLAEILSRIDGTPPGGERGAVIEAQVVGLDAAYHLARLGFDGGEFRLPDTGLVLGQRVRLHIRAGDVAVAVGKPDGLSILNALPALIEASRPSLDAAVELDLAVGPTRLVARVTRLSADSLGLVPGRSVYALVKSIALDRGRVLPMA